MEARDPRAGHHFMNLYVWKNRVLKFFDNPRAIFPFLRKRLYYNFIADRYLNYYKDFKYLSYDETFDDIIQNNKSLVRFGDELFDMLLGIGLYFGDWRQRYDRKLAEKLREVVSSNNPRLLIAFNPEFILKTKQEFIKEGIPEQYHFWTHSKIFLKDYLNKGQIYGSALLFNPKFNKHINYVKLKAHFSTKHIIVVVSNPERFKSVSLGITTDFVECPGSDAWRSYESVREALLSKIKQRKLDQKSLLILISMSSAGKVLIHELTAMGYTAWDTGQFFDLASKEIKNM